MIVFHSVVIVATGWDNVSAKMRPLTGPLSIPPMTHDWIWSAGENILTGENWRTRRKPIPVPLCPPHIPRGLTWERIGVSPVRSRLLTAWAMTRPSYSGTFTMLLQTVEFMQHRVKYEYNHDVTLSGEQSEMWGDRWSCFEVTRIERLRKIMEHLYQKSEFRYGILFQCLQNAVKPLKPKLV
jgi:hypothetical protein